MLCDFVGILSPLSCIVARGHSGVNVTIEAIPTVQSFKDCFDLLVFKYKDVIFLAMVCFEGQFIELEIECRQNLHDQQFNNVFTILLLLVRNSAFTLNTNNEYYINNALFIL